MLFLPRARLSALPNPAERRASRSDARHNVSNGTHRSRHGRPYPSAPHATHRSGSTHRRSSSPRAAP
eukprot:2114504-Prymnesium_polylepis.1